MNKFWEFIDKISPKKMAKRRLTSLYQKQPSPTFTERTSRNVQNCSHFSFFWAPYRSPRKKQVCASKRRRFGVQNDKKINLGCLSALQLLGKSQGSSQPLQGNEQPCGSTPLFCASRALCWSCSKAKRNSSSTFK